MRMIANHEMEVQIFSRLLKLNKWCSLTGKISVFKIEDIGSNPITAV